MHVPVSLAFITFLHVLSCIMLHGGLVVSHPQGFPREGSSAQMLTADALMDFKQYVFLHA